MTLLALVEKKKAIRESFLCIPACRVGAFFLCHIFLMCIIKSLFNQQCYFFIPGLFCTFICQIKLSNFCAILLNSCNGVQSRNYAFSYFCCAQWKLICMRESAKCLQYETYSRYKNWGHIPCRLPCQKRRLVALLKTLLTLTNILNL